MDVSPTIGQEGHTLPGVSSEARSPHEVALAHLRRDGRSTRWDPHRRQRRLTIIEAAIAAIEEHGPDALTAQVAQKAGVPRTHVYRHFDGKQALDLAVTQHVARQIGEAVHSGLARATTPRGLISGAVRQHLTWVEAHPNLYRFLAQQAYTVARTGSHVSDDAKAALAAELTGVVQRYLGRLGADPAPAERVIVGVVGMVDNTATWWLEHGTVTRDELTTDLTEQVWLLIEHMNAGLGLRLGSDDPLPPPR